MKITIILALALLAVCAVLADPDTKVPNEVDPVNLDVDLGSSTQGLEKHNLQKRANCQIERCLAICRTRSLLGVCVKGKCRCQ